MLLPMNFPLYYTLHQLAPAVSDCVAKEGEFTAHNKSEKLSGGVSSVRVHRSVRCSVQLTRNIRQ